MFARAVSLEMVGLNRGESRRKTVLDDPGS